MNVVQKKPKYAEQKDQILSFLKDFSDKRGVRKYWDIMQRVANREQTIIEIEIDDIIDHGLDELATWVETNTMRYVKLFADAIDSNEMPKADANLRFQDDVVDCLLQSRMKMMKHINDPSQMPDPKAGLPNELLRRYEIIFNPRSSEKSLKVRAITAHQIGALVTVQGIVTRVTDVRPLMRVATYLCDVCGNEIYQIVNKKRYSPLLQCPSEQCQRNRNKRPVLPQTRGSKFSKFQEIKLQESPEEVPEGNVPRSITIYAMGECTRICTCGDKVTISGVWLPIPFSGFKGIRAGLTTNTYLHSMKIVKEKKGYVMSQQNEVLLERVAEMHDDPQVYSKLSRSIAPEIYGLEDVKKALLILLVAGVTKQQVDGLKIRGDINILLMGDPGVAKSQLLKHITTVAPRSVYTTGKGSSGVGLTAAVIRDAVTRDMVLEGGALVLSDMGICCIDEFDKMEESDRTAIHEVMEQQTISIAKAGITTTLNARTAILAAANPAFGRYDKKRSPEQNINLPAALLSRFDLLFVLVDQPNLDNDVALARHITYVHQHNRHPTLDFEPYSSEILRAYITKARQYEPVIPRDLTEYIINCYVQMRSSSLDDQGKYQSRKIVGTPRALLSILRISQALARLRFSDEVTQSDVAEAIRLITEAKRSTLHDEDIEREMKDIVTQIYNIMIDQFKARGRTKELRVAEIKQLLTTRGYTTEQIQQTIDTYEETDVWVVSGDGETISLV